MTRYVPRNRSRIVAALVFAVAGLIVPVTWYGPVVIHGGVPLWALFFGLPALAAGALGAVGVSFLHPPRCGSAPVAALRGAGLAFAAYVFFAIPFGVGMSWADGNPSATNGLGISMLILTAGLLVAGPWVLGLGAAAGAVVWLVLRGQSPQGRTADPRVDPSN